MKTYTSVGTPKISFSTSTAIEPDREFLKTYFEDGIRAGVIFKPDQLVQVGCMITRLVTVSSDELEVYEPDMKQMPIQFTGSADNTLVILRKQKSVNESLNLQNQIVFAPVNHYLITCSQYRQKDFIMDRGEVENNNTGWFIGCTDKDHDHNNIENLKRISVYEAMLAKPEIIELLALPPGTFVIKSEINLIIYKDDIELSVQQGSYLQQKYAL